MYSRLLQNISPSPTLALNTKAQDLAKKGHKIFNFTVGEPFFGTPQVITDQAIESLTKGRTKYSQAGGSLPLRTAIAAKLQRENKLEFQPNDIVAGIGAKEILFHAFMSILNPSDEVILLSPYWVSYPDQIQAFGGTAKVVSLVDGGEISISAQKIAEIDAATSSKTKAIVLNFPNNPSGFVASEAELKTLGEYLKKQNYWIISDEIYEYLSFDHPHVSLLNLFPELRSRFIYVNGMSKGFAMTGWRVGYVACADKTLVQNVKNLQSHSSTCLPQFTEDASVVALNAGKNLVKSEMVQIQKTRDMCMALLDQHNISYTRPHGAFYIFLDLRAQLKKAGLTCTQFCEKLLMEHYVAMVPGSAFGCPGFVRMSYSQTNEMLREGIEIFAKSLI